MIYHLGQTCSHQGFWNEPRLTDVFAPIYHEPFKLQGGLDEVLEMVITD